MTTMHRARNWMIKVYGSEHGIPHYHLLAPEGRAVIEIADGAVLSGSVSSRTLAEARSWAAGHSAELLAEWRKLNPHVGGTSAVLTIASVTPIPPTTLHVGLSDGKTLRLDLAALVGTPGFEALVDADCFLSVGIADWGHGIEWPAIDQGLPVETLIRLSREQAGTAFPTVEFNAWLKRNGLTLATAAQALGLPRRTIVHYNTGQKPIPIYIGLACDGWDARKQRAA